MEIFIPLNKFFADAANRKWGIVYYKEKARDQIQGCWTPNESLLHINNKETLVILKALKALPIKFHQSHILVCSDNRTVVSTINRQGSVCSPFRQDIMKQIANLCHKNSLSLKAKYLKGSNNIAADISYKVFNECRIKSISRIIRSIVQRPGDLSIDRSVLERYQTDSKVRNINSSPRSRSIGCVHNELGVVQSSLCVPSSSSNIPKVLYKWSKEKMNNSLLLVAQMSPKDAYYVNLQNTAEKVVKLNLQESDLLIPTMTGLQSYQGKKSPLFACIL